MLKTLTFYLFLVRTSIRASIVKRGAFILEAIIMVLNNLAFFVLWWIFFHQFNDVNGWNIHDMAALMAIGLGAYGLLQVGLGGIKYLSKHILSGDLDSFMTKPKNLLLHIAGSKSFAKGWGHLLSAAVLLMFSNVLSLSSLPLILLGMVCGCCVFASMAIIAHSLSFWFGGMENVSKKYFEGLFLFALYPTNIYSGVLQLVMFTLIPAGVITFLPVELLRHFTWEKLILLLASTAIFMTVAYWIFYAGLRHYESGNRFGFR